MKNIFNLNTNIPYNLSSRSGPYCRNPKTVKYGTETISYLAPKIWFLIPEAIKSSKSLDAFKSKIKQWEPDCICRLLRLLATCRFDLVFQYLLHRQYGKRANLKTEVIRIQRRLLQKLYKHNVFNLF